MHTVERDDVVGVPIDSIPSMDVIVDAMTLAQTTHQPWLMTFANPATSVAVRRHPQFRSVLQQFNFVAPDGVGMVIAKRLLHRGSATMRISFDTTSLAPVVFSEAIKNKIDIALVGGAPGVAAKAAATIRDAFPGVSIVATFDGYGDLNQTRKEVTVLQPGIVIVGMGTLLQEQFLLGLVKQGWSGLGFTCGGYLDQLGDGADYYPRWIDRYHLRWAFRLWMEPGRLWRRYLLEYPQFGLRLCIELVRGGIG